MDVVYLVTTDDDGPVHIGTCRLATLERRLDAMQAAHWQALRLIGVYRGDEQLARRLGVRARRHRLRRQWYATEAREQLVARAAECAESVNVDWRPGR